MSERIEEIPDDQYTKSVCAVDSLEKARKVAGYFGQDGVVLELDVPDSNLVFHPDYGEGPEFDTIHIITDVPPSMIKGIVGAPVDLKGMESRPAGISLRDWKMGKDAKFRKNLDDALGL